MEKLFTIEIGTPQFRIHETEGSNSKHYFVYSQEMLTNDLEGGIVKENLKDARQVTTKDRVDVVHTGEIVLSLTSGTACIVSSQHEGFLLTKNFCKVYPAKNVHALYLVYLFNEDHTVRKSLKKSKNEGLVTMITSKQLEALEFPKLPSFEVQKLIGELYFNQKKLTSLQTENAKLKEKMVIESIRRYEDDRI
ncbi:hypothetical protein C815_01065 [Firmicutes bacterium M10-2]|nr:hypothetical protein C815_01065 [Firmicutes bacterium M10-2]